MNPELLSGEAGRTFAAAPLLDAVISNLALCCPGFFSSVVFWLTATVSFCVAATGFGGDENFVRCV